ncbi:putative E3 ubiquitin-protein ligase RGLG4 [Paratrimastix pyriformis]|uniref:E3 ubiquitin-protein ligase RGLG4 n=1 Tax=Paratrimastix pyriformis TaxID=342808 RepID=A0ABQ8U5C4_9EUKA|nr:putative E3 ubiquitin-protein ligase RGLG4 [Paratrimastix pyriformis]
MGNSCAAPETKRPLNPLAIPDRFHTYGELQQGLREAGLEASQLIFAVDFTKSNMWSGEKSFHQPMHTLGTPNGNPYENVLRIISTTLEPFDDDHLIPAFGFGDVTTGGTSVFAFQPDGRPCMGFQEVLRQYQMLVPHVQLSGPTSLAPIIRQAIDIVRATAQYHICVVVTDGQVDYPDVDGAAIAEASNYPLSIVVVGVGDGPWDAMRKFDDDLPARRFDNFQFVEYNMVAQANVERNDLYFATNALMEVPDQFKLIKQLGLLSKVAMERPQFRPAAPPALRPPLPATVMVMPQIAVMAVPAPLPLAQMPR